MFCSYLPGLRLLFSIRRSRIELILDQGIGFGKRVVCSRFGYIRRLCIYSGRCFDDCRIFEKTLTTGRTQKHVGDVLQKYN